MIKSNNQHIFYHCVPADNDRLSLISLTVQNAAPVGVHWSCETVNGTMLNYNVVNVDIENEFTARIQTYIQGHSTMSLLNNGRVYRLTYKSRGYLPIDYFIDKLYHLNSDDLVLLTSNGKLLFYVEDRIYIDSWLDDNVAEYCAGDYVLTSSGNIVKILDSNRVFFGQPFTPVCKYSVCEWTENKSFIDIRQISNGKLCVVDDNYLLYEVKFYKLNLVVDDIKVKYFTGISTTYLIVDFDEVLYFVQNKTPYIVTKFWCESENITTVNVDNGKWILSTNCYIYYFNADGSNNNIIDVKIHYIIQVVNTVSAVKSATKV